MPASRGLLFSRIADQLSAAKKTLSPIHCCVSVPGGFPYEAYNGSAWIKPWSILRMVETCRATVFNVDAEGNSFLDSRKNYQDLFVFIAATKNQVSQDMYNHSIKKSPLQIEVELVQVGTSSFNLQTSISCEHISQPLCINNVQSVFVSNKTRKPTLVDGKILKTDRETSSTGESLFSL